MRLSTLTLMAVLMAACGSSGTAPSNDDASVVTMEDGGNPTSDVATETLDLPVVMDASSDVVVASDGQQIVIDDAGIPAPFLCGPQLCDMPLRVINFNSLSEEVVPHCNAAHTRLDFGSARIGSGWGDCSGNTCGQPPVDSCTTLLVFRMEAGECTSFADVVAMCNGQPIARTGGPIRLEPR